jgi:L-ascorbate metabolism protein UlaG (beta-lactamase superfamily)
VFPTRLGAAAVALAIGAPDPGFRQPVGEDGRFVNLDGSGPTSFARVMKWLVIDSITGNRRRSPPSAPVPRLEPDATLLSRPPGRGQGARLTWIGHASFLVQLDGVSLLVDPVLEPSLFGGLSRNVPPGLGYEQLPKVDAVLVSHSHYDHLDLPTLKQVGAPVVAGLGLRNLLRREGLACATVGWWQTLRFGAVTVTFVPAQHWSRRWLSDANTTLWGGFVIQGPSATIYHAGDTGWFEGFAEIGHRFPAIDAALLPIGAYDPEWLMAPIHLNPEEALRAFRDLGARTFVAMHWGTFKQTDEPLDEPPARLEAERVRLGLPAERVRVLAVGETLEVSRRPVATGAAVAPAGG